MSLRIFVCVGKDGIVRSFKAPGGDPVGFDRVDCPKPGNILQDEGFLCYAERVNRDEPTPSDIWEPLLTQWFRENPNPFAMA